MRHGLDGPANAASWEDEKDNLIFAVEFWL